MNLALVYQLLAAASEQRPGFLKLTNSWADGDVEEMASAGLIELTPRERKGEPIIAIKRVTAAGQSFLRAFEGHVFPHQNL